MIFKFFGKSIHLGSPNLSEPKELREERNRLVDAMSEAVETKKPVKVEVGGKEVEVVDGGYGREIRPV